MNRFLFVITSVALKVDRLTGQKILWKYFSRSSIKDIRDKTGHLVFSRTLRRKHTFTVFLAARGWQRGVFLGCWTTTTSSPWLLCLAWLVNKTCPVCRLIRQNELEYPTMYGMYDSLQRSECFTRSCDDTIYKEFGQKRRKRRISIVGRVSSSQSDACFLLLQAFSTSTHTKPEPDFLASPSTDRLRPTWKYSIRLEDLWLSATQ